MELPKLWGGDQAVVVGVAGRLTKQLQSLRMTSITTTQPYETDNSRSKNNQRRILSAYIKAFTVE